MTPSVSHTAENTASAGNRAQRPTLTEYFSTTALLRHAHHVSNGDALKAVQLLRALADIHANAHAAIRVLTRRVKGAPCFRIERNGFVRGEQRPTPPVGTVILGDLRFEHSGDSMAVYDATMPWPAPGDGIRHTARLAQAALIERLDLPDCSELTFVRAAHDYASARMPDTPEAA